MIGIITLETTYLFGRVKNSLWPPFAALTKMGSGYFWSKDVADLIEAQQLSCEEELNHWWIRTRFLYIEKALSYLSNSGNKFCAVEFGCGTGQNLEYLTKSSAYHCWLDCVYGVEPNLTTPSSFSRDQSQVYIVQKLPEAVPKAQIILVMDVLEHIENDRMALLDWKQHLDSGGIALITVPAFPILWSDRDKFLHHHRRYYRHQVIRLAEDCGFQVLYCRYIFSWAFPVVFFVRKIFRRQQKKHSSELVPIHPVLNRLFYFFGQLEYLLPFKNLFGTSVVAILRKR